jgi:hypothetical protein
MEFWGIIYERRYKSNGLFNFSQSKYDNIELINHKSFKKYRRGTAWIIDCEKTYFSKFDYKNYLKNSENFLRLGYSEKENILVLELIQKNKVKKHIIVSQDVLISNFKVVDKKSTTIDIREIISDILYDTFLIKLEELKSTESDFYKMKFDQTKNPISMRKVMFDIYFLFQLPSAIGLIIISFIVSYLIITGQANGFTPQLIYWFIVALISLIISGYMLWNYFLLISTKKRIDRFINKYVA